MAELLKLLLEKRPHDPYVRRLLDAFDVEEATGRPTGATSEKHQDEAKEGAASDAPISEILSNREIDVLELLEKRLSNKEIAEQLFISPDTVKKHTINIYRKLEAPGRRQAVAAARKLGLLPEK